MCFREVGRRDVDAEHSGSHSTHRDYGILVLERGILSLAEEDDRLSGARSANSQGGAEHS